MGDVHRPTDKEVLSEAGVHLNENKAIDYGIDFPKLTVREAPCHMSAGGNSECSRIWAVMYVQVLPMQLERLLPYLD